MPLYFVWHKSRRCENVSGAVSQISSADLFRRRRAGARYRYFSRNAVKSGRLSHAYLLPVLAERAKPPAPKFSQKRLTVKIPWTAIRAENVPPAAGIDDGSILDVIEIDAASNNGVDNIRDLREEANYTPSAVKYRVYIIDEVHMLSVGAFNALLKTLEEPPEHVKFILATTEVHKLSF